MVIELEPDQLQVIGRPIPACESDPISRAEQACKMAGFLAGLSQVADPPFTHWVVVKGQIVGEAHSVEPEGDGQSFAFVRLFNMPENSEYGYIETACLRSKDA